MVGVASSGPEHSKGVSFVPFIRLEYLYKPESFHKIKLNSTPILKIHFWRRSSPPPAKVKEDLYED